MQFEFIRSYYIGMIWLSVALAFVSFTNIFPFTVGVNGIDYNTISTGISEDWNNSKSTFANPNSLLDYFSIVGAIMQIGYKLILGAIAVVFGGIGMVFYSFGIDWRICAAIQVPIDAAILFELGQTASK
jgi:hypothetical protein